jgi:hypothetical protein
MKVFISWSGDTSKALAEALRGWLPSVVQAVKPYFSPDDIIKGSRWSTEIAKELEECKIGLICLTADNLEAPWIMFETGALSKSISAARVCPLLFGVEPSDVKGPLVQFQAAPFARDEMKKAVRMMNQELGSQALTSDVLESVFEMWWPKLEDKVKKIMASAQVPAKQGVRSERDILEEILARVRAVPPIPSRMGVHPGALEDLLDTYARLMLEVSHLPPEARGELVEIADRLRMPIDHIVGRVGIDSDELSPGRRERLDMLRRRLTHEDEFQLPLATEDTEHKGKAGKRVRRTR